MPPIFDQVLPTNFGPLVTDKVIIDSDYYGGELSITELAESLQPEIPKSNIASLFPQRDVEATMIRIQQFHKPTGTIFSFVEKGMPDTFLSQSGNMLGEWIVQPFYMRASFYVSHGEINSKVKPGTTNTRWGAVEQIQEKVKEFMVAHEKTWDVVRTYVLCGSFDFLDPRTNTRTKIPSNIPDWNLINYNVTSGYKGRKDHAMFRTLIDSNVADPGSAVSGVPWTNPDAAIVECVMSLAQHYQLRYKRRLTKMFIHPEMQMVLTKNRQVRNAMSSSWLPAFNTQAGDNELTVQSVTLDKGVLGFGSVGVDANGSVNRIGSIQVEVLDESFKDPRDGTFHGILPKNKVIFVSEEGAAPGETVKSLSEEYGGKPGLWTRTSENVPPPNAPGYAFQVGDAGVVYLKYPESVVHMTVCEVEDIQNSLVYLGDSFWGMY